MPHRSSASVPVRLILSNPAWSCVDQLDAVSVAQRTAKPCVQQKQHVHTPREPNCVAPMFRFFPSSTSCSHFFAHLCAISSNPCYLPLPCSSLELRHARVSTYR